MYTTQGYKHLICSLSYTAWGGLGTILFICASRILSGLIDKYIFVLLAYGNHWEVYHNNLNILLNLTRGVFMGADGEGDDCLKI